MTKTRTAKIQKENEAMRKVLYRCFNALEDWLNVYASEHCDEVRVKEAHKRITEAGGTIAYVAELLNEIEDVTKNTHPQVERKTER